MRWNLSVAGLAASWGLVAVIVAGVELDAAVLAFYRLALAAVALAAGLALTRRAGLLRPPRGRALLVGAVLGLHWLLFFQTIKLSSVAFGILVVYTGPIFLALLAPLFLPENRSRVVYLALPVAAAGVGMLALGDDELTQGRPLAVATGLGAALLFVALIILTKQALVSVRVLTLQLWNCVVGALVLAPFLLTAERVVPRGIEIASVLLLSIVFTVTAGSLYVWLMRRVSAQAIGVLGYVEPVSAALLAWVLLGERLTWAVAAGGGLVVGAGIAVAVFEPREAASLEAPFAPLRSD